MLVALCGTVALCASFLAGQVPARANDSVTVNNLTLVKSDINGNPSKSAIRNGDVVKLTFDWDGRAGNLQSGDSFAVALPSVFDNLEYPQTRDLKVDHNGAQVVVGQCALTKKEIKCSFNEQVDTLRNQGFTGFYGTATALLSVQEVWKAGTAPITVNGTAVEVAIPGGSIGEKERSTYVPTGINKSGGNITAKSTDILWEINFDSNTVKDALAKAGNPIVVDGKTRSSITFTDVLGSGHEFPDLSGFRIMLRNSVAEPDIPNGINLADGAGKDISVAYGDFDLTVVKNGNTATITATGPFAPDTNYRIHYTSTPNTANGLIQPGFKYTNSATLDGSGVASTFERYYSESFSVEIKMEAGYGAFNITKLLEGAAAGSVPAGTTFTTKVKYTLPGNATVDAYPGWKAPGTVNSDKTGGVADFTVTAGQKVNFTASTFPRGTVVELSEDPATASATPDGVAWGTPEFKVETTATNSFTIADRRNTSVFLTNSANPKVGTFSVSKSVNGAPVTDKDYAFTYTCTDGQSGSIAAKGDGVAVEVGKTFPLGTRCTVKEDADAARVPGFDLTAPADQTVTIAQAGVVTPVAFVNAYAAKTGDFSIAKKVTGNPAAANRSFTFTYDCANAGNGSLLVPGDGSVVKSPKLPVGATCAISEDPASAAIQGYSVDSSLSQKSVTIAENSTVAVTATNAYARNEGSFSVAKTVETDDGADFTGDTYHVDYQCTDGTEGTLKVPGDGRAVESPRIPEGTTCFFSEQFDHAEKPGYGLASEFDLYSAKIVKDSIIPVKVTNRYRHQTTNFVISKTVAGDAVALAPKTFEFDYVCRDLLDRTIKTGSVTVEAGKSATVAGGIPRGQCTVTEKDASVKGTRWEVESEAIEPDRPPEPEPVSVRSEPSSVVLARVWTSAAPSIGTARKTGKESVTFDIAEDESIPVNFRNTYTLLRGSFSVAKKVSGPEGLDLSKHSFVFDYTCASTVEGEVTGQIQVPGDGSAVAAGVRIPLYATCRVSEKAASATVAGYDVALPAEQTFTIDSEGSVKALEFANVYTRQIGSFSVVKRVSGIAGQEGKEFGFAYECSDGTKGNLTAKGDGKAVALGKNLSAGTICTISEDAASAKIDGYEVTTPSDRKVTIPANGEVVEATFVNEYAATPPAPSPSPSATPTPTPSATATPTPSAPAGVPSTAAPSSPGKSNPPGKPGKTKPPTTKPGSALPRTGVHVLSLGVLALGALAGGVVLVLRRRRS